MPTETPVPSDLRRLIRTLRSLPPQDRALVLALVERLAAGRSATPAAAPLSEPIQRPRPPEESVIAAIRRLSQTYVMLDRGAMLNETAALMSAHVLQGRAAAEVIDDLEQLFARHYESFRAGAVGAPPASDPSR